MEPQREAFCYLTTMEQHGIGLSPEFDRWCLFEASAQPCLDLFPLLLVLLAARLYQCSPCPQSLQLRKLNCSHAMAIILIIWPTTLQTSIKTIRAGDHHHHLSSRQGVLIVNMPL